MKKILLPILATLIISCNPKVKDKNYAFDELGWSIEVPSDFETLDSTTVAKLNSKGQQALEKTYDVSADFSQTKTLISFKKGQVNTFTATITPFDPTTDGKWEEMNKELKNMMYETSQAQMPDIKIDTSSSVEKIATLEFDKFYSKMTYPNGMVLHSYLYSQLRKGYDFGITITYTDEKIGERIKAIMLNSKFN